MKPLFSFGFHNWQTDSLIFNIQLPFWFIYLHAIHFIQWQVILYEDKPDWFIPTQSINWNWAILTLLATFACIKYDNIQNLSLFYGINCWSSYLTYSVFAAFYFDLRVTLSDQRQNMDLEKNFAYYRFQEFCLRIELNGVGLKLEISPQF